MPSRCYLPRRYAGDDDVIPTPGTASPRWKLALQAKPREQCFLYTELVHTMTEIAGKQMLAGDTEAGASADAQARRALRHNLIHLGLANDTKRLKNAEMLMHHTTLPVSLSTSTCGFQRRQSATLQSHLEAAGSRSKSELLDQVFNH